MKQGPVRFYRVCKSRVDPQACGLSIRFAAISASREGTSFLASRRRGLGSAWQRWDKRKLSEVCFQTTFLHLCNILPAGSSGGSQFRLGIGLHTAGRLGTESAHSWKSRLSMLGRGSCCLCDAAVVPEQRLASGHVTGHALCPFHPSLVTHLAE